MPELPRRAKLLPYLSHAGGRSHVEPARRPRHDAISPPEGRVERRPRHPPASQVRSRAQPQRLRELPHRTRLRQLPRRKRHRWRLQPASRKLRVRMRHTIPQKPSTLPRLPRAERRRPRALPLKATPPNVESAPPVESVESVESADPKDGTDSRLPRKVLARALAREVYANLCLRLRR